MKKIIFTFILFFIFIVLNYKYVFYNYYNAIGNKTYNNNIFSGALMYHNNALGYKETPTILYNIGNDYFKIAEGVEDKQEKLFNYKLSEKNYINSLDIKEDKETRFNLDLVRKKIKELESSKEDNKKEKDKNQNNKEQEKNKNQEEKQEDKNNDGDDSKNSENNGEKDKNQEENKDSNNGEGSGGANNNILKQPRENKYKLGSNTKVGPTSDKEKQFLEDYLEFLDSQEKQNQKYFNKNDEPNTSNIDSFLNMFGGSINLDNTFNNGGEKDW